MRARILLAANALLVVMLACRDDHNLPTEPAPTTRPEAASAAATLAFWQVSGGGLHTCAVTTDNIAYCWGYNAEGQLGSGTLSGPEWCPDAASGFPCSTHPVLVNGSHRFRQVSAGEYHTCAIGTDSLAFCWGSNGSGTGGGEYGAGGQLGDGTITTRLTPVRVVDGHRFLQVDAGYSHTCGVAIDHRAYCWGSNQEGQLGDGTLTMRLTPTLVLGGYRFRQVTAGHRHTCGVTTTNQVYCWGVNDHGQLGDSTTIYRRKRPYPVVGTRQYRFVDAGWWHTCAVTTMSRAYCWGEGQAGQLGFGKNYRSRWPRAVVGGLYFRRVTAGVAHTCGETTTDRVYCWGLNRNGQLGDGTTSNRLVPVAVKGGLYFKQLSAGDQHTCGKSPSAAGYCWGDGFYGQLGIGQSGGSLTPVSIVGPLE